MALGKVYERLTNVCVNNKPCRGAVAAPLRRAALVIFAVSITDVFLTYDVIFNAVTGPHRVIVTYYDAAEFGFFYK